MKTSELKKIVEENGYYFAENDSYIFIRRLSYGDYKLRLRLHDNSITMGYEEHLVDKKLKNCMVALIEYSETPLNERADKFYTFTDFEKEFLKQGYSDYPYITRDKSGFLFMYTIPPKKHNSTWSFECDGSIRSLDEFMHLFQSVQWEDDQPCEWGKWV